MKNYKSILIQTTLILVFMIGAISCTDNKPEDTKVIALESNEEKFDDNKNEKDAKFLVNAAEINMVEVNLGKLAQQKGTLKSVKELGKMMEDDHSKSLNDLIALAKSKNMTLPTSTTNDAMDDYKKMNDKSVSDFDKEYSEKMVKDHKNAVDLFEKAANDGNDSDIKAWASNTLPTLRKHLEQAEMCKKESDNK